MIALSDLLLALAGGALIGVAAGAFLILSGRIAGVSGIVGGLLRPGAGGWRVAFLLGLVAGGGVLVLVYPAAFPDAVKTGKATLIAAGLLVGFGTRLGSGCTSGHGVCGVARLSPRSLVATATFMAVGGIVVGVVG